MGSRWLSPTGASRGDLPTTTHPKNVPFFENINKILGFLPAPLFVPITSFFQDAHEHSIWPPGYFLPRYPAQRYLLYVRACVRGKSLLVRARPAREWGRGPQGEAQPSGVWDVAHRYLKVDPLETPRVARAFCRGHNTREKRISARTSQASVHLAWLQKSVRCMLVLTSGLISDPP
jgi:hypothetical protein